MNDSLSNFRTALNPQALWCVALAVAVGWGTPNRAAAEPSYGILPMRDQTPGNGWAQTRVGSDAGLQVTSTVATPLASTSDSVNVGGVQTYSVASSASASLSSGKVTLQVNGNDLHKDNPWFPVGQSNAGWVDEVTIKLNQYADGTAGLWFVPVKLTANIVTTPLQASAFVGLEAYVNASRLGPYGGTINQLAFDTFNAKNVTRNEAVLEAWDYQHVEYGAKQYPNDNSNVPFFNLNSQPIWFVVPFIAGTPFHFAVAIEGAATTSSFPTYDGSNSYAATAEFGDIGGPGSYIEVDKLKVSGDGFNVASISDLVNYSKASAVPEIDPAGGSAVLGVLVAAWGLLDRRRLKS